MSGSVYRVLFTDLLTQQTLGELPVLSFSIKEGINVPGSFSATLMLADTYSIEVPDGAGGSTTLTTPQKVSLDTVTPGETGVFVERDGVLIWGGMIWTARLNVAESTMEIGAEGFLSYLRRLNILTDLSYYDIDQGAIAKALVDYAMTNSAGSNIGITAATPTASKTRVRVYPGIDRKPIGEALEQLAAVNEGFDFYFTHSWNAGETAITTAFTIDTDTLGRFNNSVLELGVNVSLLSLSVDGTGRANYVEAWGSSDEYDMHVTVSTGATDRPRLERIDRYSDVKEYSTLSEKATKTLVEASDPVKRLELQIYPDSVPVYGSYQVGERMTVQGSYGGLSVSGIWRITDLSLSVDSDGKETVGLSMIPQGHFS